MSWEDREGRPPRVAKEAKVDQSQLEMGPQMRLLFVLLVAILSGCGVDTSVQLLTGTDPHGCYAGGESHFEGLLAVDQKWGTSINGKPAIWPVGWTGRRVGLEVEVLDDAGKVRAITGRRYYFAVGPISNPESLARLKGIVAATVSSCPGDIKEVD